MIRGLEEQIGTIRNRSSCPIQSISNKVDSLTVITEDGKRLRFVENSFNDEPEYPNKKKVESYVSKTLCGQGIAVPRIMCDDEGFIFKLSSSLFEKSLEILTYFRMGKDSISESKRESILNKYGNLVNKHYLCLCRNLGDQNYG